MAELGDTLSSILNNPEAMGQIMSLAQSLSGKPTGDGSEAQEENTSLPEQNDSSGDAVQELLRKISPEMVQQGVDLLGKLEGESGSGAALMQALRPYVSEKKQSKLDRALQLARTTRLIRTAVAAVGQKEESGDV